MTINFDFDYNEIENFKKFCENYNIKILKFIENGPGGGNPNVTVYIDDADKLFCLGVFYFNG